MATSPPDPSSSPFARRTVRCPACGGPSVYAPDNPWRPFCSERCRTLDLGAWASEAYRIGAAPTDAPADDDGTEGPGDSGKAPH